MSSLIVNSLSREEFKERLRELREGNPGYWGELVGGVRVSGKVSNLEKFMPFMESRIRSEGCKGLNHNNYLYTQCTRKVVSGGYCKTCKRSSEKNGGIPKYGSIEERKKSPLSSYKPEKAKGAVRYLDVLKEHNITREEMEKYAESIGVTISDEIWNDDFVRIHPGKGRKKKEGSNSKKENKSGKKKRGRPKKVKEESSPKKKRGRPKKEKKSEKMTPKERAEYMANSAENEEKNNEEVESKEEVIDEAVSTEEVTVEMDERPSTPRTDDEESDDEENENFEVNIVKSITHDGIEYQVDSDNNLRDSDGEEKGMIMDDGEIVIW